MEINCNECKIYKKNKSFKMTMNMKHYTDISFHITMEY